MLVILCSGHDAGLIPFLRCTFVYHFLIGLRYLVCARYDLFQNSVASDVVD